MQNQDQDYTPPTVTLLGDHATFVQALCGFGVNPDGQFVCTNGTRQGVLSV